jgi:hypothetical protein
VSVEFEPVKLAQRRRRADPVVLGVLFVVVAIGTAVLKPWDQPAGSVSGPEPGLVGPGPSGSPAGPQVALAPVLPRILTTTATFASPEVVRTALRPHDAWGVRAIVAEPSPAA